MKLYKKILFFSIYFFTLILCADVYIYSQNYIIQHSTEQTKNAGNQSSDIWGETDINNDDEMFPSLLLVFNSQGQVSLNSFIVNNHKPQYIYSFWQPPKSVF